MCGRAQLEEAYRRFCANHTFAQCSILFWAAKKAFDVITDRAVNTAWC
jgi:hypothetical protein